MVPYSVTYVTLSGTMSSHMRFALAGWPRQLRRAFGPRAGMRTEAVTCRATVLSDVTT